MRPEWPKSRGRRAGSKSLFVKSIAVIPPQAKLPQGYELNNFYENVFLTSSEEIAQHLIQSNQESKENRFSPLAPDELLRLKDDILIYTTSQEILPARVILGRTIKNVSPDKPYGFYKQFKGFDKSDNKSVLIRELDTEKSVLPEKRMQTVEEVCNSWHIGETLSPGSEYILGHKRLSKFREDNLEVQLNKETAKCYAIYEKPEHLNLFDYKWKDLPSKLNTIDIIGNKGYLLCQPSRK